MLLYFLMIQKRTSFLLNIPFVGFFILSVCVGFQPSVSSSAFGLVPNESHHLAQKYHFPTHRIKRKTPPITPTANYHTTKLTSCITGPSLVNFCFPELLFLQRMSLSHMEDMPLSHSSPQGTPRTSWKQWFLYSTIVPLLLLCSFSTLILTFLPLKVRRQQYLKLLPFFCKSF